MGYLQKVRRYHYDRWLEGACNPRNGDVDLLLGKESNEVTEEYENLKVQWKKMIYSSR